MAPPDSIEALSSPDQPQEAVRPSPGPYPWYVVVLTGLAFGGVFPWLMLSWALYQRKERKVAWMAFLGNMILLLSLGWVFWSVQWPWWSVTSFDILFNLVWTISAFFFQKKVLGPAPGRYDFSKWKSWIPHILLGLMIGICIGTICSVGAAFEKKAAIQKTRETLDRSIILWDFFQYAGIGGLLGLLLGFGWAGRKKGASAGQVVSSLAALVVALPAWGLLWYLSLFVMFGGTMPTGKLHSSLLIPPWVFGFQGWLFRLQGMDLLPLLVLPLFFADVSRIREFWKRSLIIPLIFICSLPLTFSSNDWWKSYQKHIQDEMSSAEPADRALAYDRAEVLLVRYPDHVKWPQIAEKLARRLYLQGDIEKSRMYYQMIVDRYNGSNEWYWAVKRARAALMSPNYGNPEKAFQLAVPVVDYENYLTHNWMALLSVIRYHEGPDVPESQVAIRLKQLSTSDDKIQLNPLGSLADLDDAARNLGYDMLILPSDLETVRKLVRAGFPVIHSCYDYFNVIFGWDDGRAVFKTYQFYELSERTRKEGRKVAEEIMSLEEEGQGESLKRLTRIAEEVYEDSTMAYWQDPALRFTGPLMAVVFPAEKADRIASTLERSVMRLQVESNGFLASQIASAFLNKADPVNALTWARTASKLINDPLPLYEAYLVQIWWENRERLILNRMELESRLRPLGVIKAFFEEPETVAFLQQARSRFEQDLKAHMVPWAVTSEYVSLLDKSLPDDLKQMIEISRMSIDFNPSYYGEWRYLAGLYEFENNVPQTIKALTGAISCNPMDSRTKLRAAYFSVLNDEMAQAETLIKTADPDKIRYDADYEFCLGAISEWRGDTSQALDYYKKAITMRCYKPIYHLKYAQLLQKQGHFEEAQRALDWATGITVGKMKKKFGLSDSET